MIPFHTRCCIAGAVLCLVLHPFAEMRAQEAPSSEAPAAQPGEIVVSTWGGAYAQSQERAFFAPFKTDSGIAVRVVSHNGDAGARLGEDSAKWDVIDMSAGAVRKACEDGLLVKIDRSKLAEGKDGSKADEDYLPGALSDCGVGSVAWSAVIAFDKREFTKSQPGKASDLFDPKAFPGKRALPRDPKWLFELTLAATGVAPGDIYKTLGTDEGLEKVFAELDRIRDDIVWWDKPGDPLQLLADGKVDMALAFSGRVFASIVGDNQPFGVIWDGQVYDMDMWAIPKSSPRAEAAMRFIGFASRPERLAAQTRWFPYGPLRKSSLALVGKHAEVDVDMSAFLPTAPGNFKTAVRYDAAFWSENGERIAKRLEEWRAPKAEEAKEKDGTDDAKESE